MNKSPTFSLVRESPKTNWSEWFGCATISGVIALAVAVSWNLWSGSSGSLAPGIVAAFWTIGSRSGPHPLQHWFVRLIVLPVLVYAFAVVALAFMNSHLSTQPYFVLVGIIAAISALVSLTKPWIPHPIGRMLISFGGTASVLIGLVAYSALTGLVAGGFYAQSVRLLIEGGAWGIGLFAGGLMQSGFDTAGALWTRLCRSRLAEL